MASPLSSADGTPETASTLKTSAGGDAPGELATPRSPSQPASCDQRAVVATDERATGPKVESCESLMLRGSTPESTRPSPPPVTVE